MNSKFDINHQPEELKLTNHSEVVEQLLKDLDDIALTNSFGEQDSLLLTDAPLKSSHVIEQGLYIVENQGQFQLVDYAVEGYEPKPLPLTPNSLVKSAPSQPIPDFQNSDRPQPTATSFLGKKGMVFGLGLGVLLTLGATRILTPQTTAEKGPPELVSETNVAAQTVTTTEVMTTDINSQLKVSGTVRAFERTPVMSQIAGLQITDILVEQGDSVQRGQVLARLSNRVLQAEQAQAEAAVNQAQARLDELQAGSRAEEVAQAESRVVNAQSAIAEATAELELVRKRVERNTTLQAEGAITRDRFDEVLNQERVAESRLASAKANLNEARQALAQLKAGSRPQTIAQAKAELAQAQGRLQAIVAQLADTTITAPQAGLIASRSAQVGQTTSTSQMLFTIIQDGRLELRLPVSETLIDNIQPGQTVQITANNNSRLNLKGKVRAIDPLIDNSSRQATVKVDLPSGTNLKPGMFLQAAINTNTDQGLAVPIEALLPQSESRAIAFVVQPDNNTVKARQVTLGEILSGQRVEIIEGLAAGERLILKGAVYLQDGDKVVISKSQETN